MSNEFDWEDDLRGTFWWIAGGFAELLIEEVSADRGPREWAGRDTATLLIYHAAVVHRCRPGQVQVNTLWRLLDDADLRSLLRAGLDANQDRQAWDCLAGVNLATGPELLREVLGNVLRNWPGAAQLEDLWPVKTIFGHGGGGACWPRA